MNDYITRRERIILSLLGKCRIWRMSRVVVGTVPLIGSIMMLVHCTLLLCGFRSIFTEWIFDCSVFGFIAWILISFAFGFCWLHRAFCTYGVLVSFCIDFQRTFGFGPTLTPMRLSVVLIGLILFLVFIHDKAWREFCVRSRIPSHPHGSNHATNMIPPPKYKNITNS